MNFRNGAAGLRVNFAAAALMLACVSAHAERIVLAPSGLTTNPETAKVEFISATRNNPTNFGWVNVGLPESLMGVEVEAERFEVAGHHRTTFSAAYSPLGNAFTDLAPTLSFGVRDILDQGREGRAIFVATTKTFGLSQSQEKFVRRWNVHAGYGTARMGGAYLGLDARFAMGFTGTVEYYQHKLNASVSIPVMRHVNMEAVSLDGEMFYGASVNLMR